MDDNNMQGNQAGNMGTRDQDARNTGQKDQYFTQDEVNKIIQSRMSRMKDQAGKEAGKEYRTKLADLEAREKKLEIREGLISRGYGAELADLIHCEDVRDLDVTLKTLDKIYGRKFAAGQSGESPEGIKPGFRVGAGRPGRKAPRADSIREAMGMDYR